MKIYQKDNTIKTRYISCFYNFYKMDNISSLLSKYKKGSDISSKITKEIFFTKFMEIIKNLIGEDLAKYIKPVYIKNNNLKIICHNSSIASLIKLKESVILEEIEKINKNFKIEKLIIEINSNF